MRYGTLEASGVGGLVGSVLVSAEYPVTLWYGTSADAVTLTTGHGAKGLKPSGRASASRSLRIPSPVVCYVADVDVVLMEL